MKALRFSALADKLQNLSCAVLVLLRITILDNQSSLFVLTCHIEWYKFAHLMNRR